MIRNFLQYINESKFLLNSDLLGYINLEDYDDIKNILVKYNDYIINNNELVWNYSNENLTKEINELTFKQEVNNIFNLKYLKYTREPIEVSSFMFDKFSNKRVNHYMIKSNIDNDFTFGEFKNDTEIIKFIKICIDECIKLGIDWSNRWCYLTIDQLWVDAGKSQREFGWHIDGMQGDEVVKKVDADFQFIWADATPTKFCTKVFDIEGLDPSKHNVFNWLGRQTEEKYCYLLDKYKIYLMNPYHVHSATISDKVQYRRFIRLSFTKTPITSIKMTINPDIKYNYEIHKTSGNIPKHLI